MKKRIALFSPVTNDFREWYILTDILKLTLEKDYDVTLFAKKESDGSVAYHEFPWRNIKNPYDLVIYNFSRGEDSAFMVPFLLTKPGLLILRSTSFAESLWRMHTSDGTEQDFLDEMAYCYGKNGTLLGNLMWRGMWGEQLERKFPLLKLAAHSSIAVCGFDSWILDRAARESVYGENRLFPSPFIYNDKKKIRSPSLLTFYTNDYPLLIEIVLAAAREAIASNLSFNLTVVSDEENRTKATGLLAKERLESVARVLVPENSEMLDTLFTDSSIFLFLEDPAAPVEYLPVILASSAGCSCVMSDSMARLSMPDFVFPKFRYRDRTKGLLEIIGELLLKPEKTAALVENAKRHFFPSSHLVSSAGHGDKMKFMNPEFVDSLREAITFSIDAAGRHSYPLGYPDHLHNFRNRLLSSMKKKVSDFPPSKKIDESLEYVIGSGLKKEI
jgi:hypothetical protein